MTETTLPYTIERIMEMIPHRYPFLLIDRVIESEKDHHAVAVKNVSVNESLFQGHFPSMKVFPGVLIVEAMAQTSAVLVVDTLGAEAEGKLVYFMSIDECKFRKPVTPGDQMHIRAEKMKQRKNIWKFDCVATVDGTKVAEAIVTAMILDD